MYNQNREYAIELIVAALLFTLFSISNGRNLFISQRNKSGIFGDEYELAQQKSIHMEIITVPDADIDSRDHQRLQPRSVKHRSLTLENGAEISISSTIKPYKNSSELSNEKKNSRDILSIDGGDISSIGATTYRPSRLSVSSNISAQERERRLMMVLAARRNALPRGSVRTRLGTTGRYVTSVPPSKAPSDVQSDCLKNCTKNFTRRTTASCMRKCSNFTRTSNDTIIIHQSSLTGSTTQTSDRDNNEILFTDESSHGLFIVAKGQNDTSNHIQDMMKTMKVRPINKDLSSVIVTSSSVEDDDIQPYLYFGEKLPPIKPGTLTITSVSEELPKLLEISANKLGPTTPLSVVSSSTLTAVERSRSRYKYRDRGYNNSRRSPTLVSTLTSMEAKRGPFPNTTSVESFIKENNEQKVDQKVFLQLTKIPSVSSSPLLITVSDENDEMTRPVQTTTELDKNVVSDSTTILYPTTFRAHLTTHINNTTMKTFLTNNPVPDESVLKINSTTSRKLSTVSSTVRPRIGVEAGIKKPNYQKVRVTQEISSHEKIEATTNTAISRVIVEEDIEKLRALGPSLTQEIKNDENIVIFLNQSSRDRLNEDIEITDKPSPILKTTLLELDHSYENPVTETPSVAVESSSSLLNEYIQPSLAGVIETTPIEKQTQLEQSNINRGDIKYTFVANDSEVSLDMRRVNIATMVLAGIGIIPLCALTLYLVRSYLFRRIVKNEEDFDVCIGDQQPISPVKQLDSKFQINSEKEDYDNEHRNVHTLHHNSTHNMPMTLTKVTSRGKNEDIRYDEQCSVTSEQEFDRSNIRLKSLLGEGNFGQVWKAEADNLSGHFGATRIVAVKTIRKYSHQSSLKEEAGIMRKLGSHQNVVTLLGVCLEIEPHMLIMEYAMRGRLLSLLRAARSAVNLLPASVPGGRSSTPLSPRTLGGFALDIACGMEYIAEKNIIHRDLAARNVLLDHNGVCKICDFGMSIDLDDECKQKDADRSSVNKIINSNTKNKLDFGSRFIIHHWNNNFNTCRISPKDSIEKKSHVNDHSHGHVHDSISRRPALPIRWMAPEALQYHIFTHETDVWAFGIVLWEISTLGSTPYANLSGREVIRRVPNGLRPELPKEARLEFYNLMTRCWHKDSHLRPSFSYARQEISRSLHKWVEDDSAESEYMDVSGFSEDLEHGMVYFNQRISEFECEI